MWIIIITLTTFWPPSYAQFQPSKGILGFLNLPFWCPRISFNPYGSYCTFFKFGPACGDHNMGTRLSKQQGQDETDEVPTLVSAQYHVINYMAQSLYIRNMVSRSRRRMLVGGYDLDMSFITDRILAMSFPAEHMKAMYRNPLLQVKSVLDARHPQHYKIYNLCIEDSYEASHFHGRVERYPFDDNHVPSLEIMKLFCESVDSWLARDPNNIVVVHCMACKGRTGTMVSTYLVYCGMAAKEALQLYADRRTTNNEGVTIPSQRRYVGYWESLLSFPKGIGHGPPVVNLPPPCTRELRRIRLYDTTNIDSIFCVVSESQEVPDELYRPSVEVSRSWCRKVKEGSERGEGDSPRYYLSYVEFDDDEQGTESESEEPRVVVQMDTESPMLYQKTCLDYYFEKPLQVTGDVRVIFYQNMSGGRLFYTCFNTAFIRNSMLQLSVGDLDKIGGKGRSICGPAFCLELLFGPTNVKSTPEAEGSLDSTFSDDSLSKSDVSSL